MGWFINMPNGSKGPFTDAQIIAGIQSGEIVSPETPICAEGGTDWISLKDYPPFASRLPKIAPATAAPSNSERGSIASSAKRIAVAVLVVLAVGLLGIIGTALIRQAPATATPLPTAAPAHVVAAPQPRAPTPLELISSAETLAGAVKVAKPLMADTNGEEVSAGAALLATWWARRPGLWNDLIAMPDTRRADILKDPEMYRGQRICVTGSVTQIFRDKSTSVEAPIYLGVMYHSGSFVRFVAVQSTQGIVENTPARFCGIAIGIQSYANVSGGTTIAVQIVGAFDLPANGGKGLPRYEDEEY